MIALYITVIIDNAKYIYNEIKHKDKSSRYLFNDYISFKTIESILKYLILLIPSVCYLLFFELPYVSQNNNMIEAMNSVYFREMFWGICLGMIMLLMISALKYYYRCSLFIVSAISTIYIGIMFQYSHYTHLYNFVINRIESNELYDNATINYLKDSISEMSVTENKMTIHDISGIKRIATMNNPIADAILPLVVDEVIIKPEYYFGIGKIRIVGKVSSFNDSESFNIINIVNSNKGGAIYINWTGKKPELNDVVDVQGVLVDCKGTGSRYDYRLDAKYVVSIKDVKRAKASD